MTATSSGFCHDAICLNLIFSVIATFKCLPSTAVFAKYCSVMTRELTYSCFAIDSLRLRGSHLNRLSVALKCLHFVSRQNCLVRAFDKLEAAVFFKTSSRLAEVGFPRISSHGSALPRNLFLDGADCISRISELGSGLKSARGTNLVSSLSLEQLLET